MNERPYSQIWMTIVYDKSLKIVDIINPQHCMLLQISKDDLFGKCKDDVVTYAVCYAEKGPDDLLYVNVIKIDEENIFEAHEGLTNYVFDITMKNVAIGVGMRHIAESGEKRYILFNDVAKKFFECSDVLRSEHWSQADDDDADEKAMQLRDPLKIEKVIRDKQGNIDRWLVLTKKKISSKANGYYIITTMIDITKRRRNEILLEQQFSLLDTMYKNIPVGIAIYDKNGCLVSLNQMCIDVLGIHDKEDVLGLNLFDEPNTPQRIKEKVRSGEDVEYEVEYDFELSNNTYFRTSICKRKLLLLKESVLRNKDGEVNGYLQICEDITEKKRKEKLLIETGLKFSTIFNSMSCGIEIYDRNCVLVDCNDYNLKIFGIEHKEDLIGQGVTFYNNPNLSPNLIEDLVNGKDVRFNLWYDFDTVRNDRYYRTSRKGRVYLETKGSPMFTDSYELIGYVFEINDITLVKEQEIKLAESHKDLVLALNAGHVSTWKYDIKNKYFTSILGNALVGDGLFYAEIEVILHPDDRRIMRKLFDDLISGKQENGDFTFRYYDNEYGGYKYYESEMKVGKDIGGNIECIIGTQRDVTGSFIHQQELEEQHRKTNLINEICNIVQWDYHPYTHILVSHSSNALFPNQNINLETDLDNLLLYAHPEDREKAIEFVNTINGKKLDTIHLEMRVLVPPAKEYRHLVCDGIAIKDNDGNVVKYSGIHRDVSEWLEVNEKLTEQNNINNLILNNINSGLLYVGTDCRIKWSNLDAFPDMVFKMGGNGYTKEHYCNCLIDGICDRWQKCMIKAAINTKKVQNKEYRFSEELIVDVASIPVYRNNGQMAGVLFKMDDITERKRLDNELNYTKEEAVRSNQILNEIINRVPGAMYIKDVADGLRYIRANEAFCKVTNRSQEEIIGNTDFEIFNKEVAEIYRQHDFKLINGEKIVSYESMPIINGVQEYLHVTKSIIRPANSKTLILGIAMNTTYMHRINEELLAAKEKAEESDKLKSAFLANMSHEIRTPLNAIVGFSGLLSESNDAAERAEYMQIIDYNNELLLRLISDVLDLSKIKSGFIELNYETFDIASTFNEVFASFKRKMTNTKVEFLGDNPYSKCMVTLDKNRIIQVGTNFITNAIKYTPSGHIRMGYVYENGGIKLYVEDTGIGIAKDKHDKVFERFEKLDDFAQGTGLGLSICKAIAEVKKGDIGFESEEGKGSTFWAWFPTTAEITEKKFFLPTNQSIIVTHNYDCKKDMQMRNLNILVAEDNDGNYMLVRAILKQDTLTRAHNGIEAVELAKANKYNAILMDIRMPEMDGLDATREIRKFDRNTLIIAVTANAFDSDRVKALAAGCDAVITKPLRKEELNKILKKIDTLAVKDTK